MEVNPQTELDLTLHISDIPDVISFNEIEQYFKSKLPESTFKVNSQKHHFKSEVPL